MYISRREKFCYILLAAFTFVWTGAFSLLGMDLHHDGIMFKTAADIAAGKWLFRETFCQYGMNFTFLSQRLKNLSCFL